MRKAGRMTNIWLSTKCSANTFAVLIGIVIGICSGFCSWLLKLMISGLTHLLTSGLQLAGGNWIFLILPLLGILLTVAYQKYIAVRDIEHGTEQIERRLKTGQYHLSSKMIYAPMIASTLTLGFGGSAGSEGPIATTSAGIGSAVGRLFHMNDSQLRTMIGIGAGAGIAGIFKAPVGGALFTIEVLMLELTTLSVIALVISCIASSMTAYVLSGYTYDIMVTSPVSFNASILPWVLIFGVLCGIYSLYYSMIMERLRRFFESRKNIWLRALLSGGLLSIFVFLFPTLYGEGYNSITDLLNGGKNILTDESIFYAARNNPWIVLALICGLLLVKPAAACSSNSGGGVAGDFAPTLFAGGILGFLFAISINIIFDTNLTTAGFAYIGMAGIMAGAIRAPLMAIFLTAEMCDGYQFFLALMIASTISYCIVEYVGYRRKRKMLSKNTGSNQAKPCQAN